MCFPLCTHRCWQYNDVRRPSQWSSEHDFPATFPHQRMKIVGSWKIVNSQAVGIITYIFAKPF
jgi:hypothetical protein